MNPIVNDVMAAFNAVSATATSIAIDRKGVVLPAGGKDGHFQGIQRLPREVHVPVGGRPMHEPLAFVITSSASYGSTN